ncbi:MAG TPA: alpha/beta hydrolase [Rhodopila sp.]|nr:alpha/beta hydrolase [Rhodopila sp.]
MSVIRHRIVGEGYPPILLVHGFGCACGDWDAQVAHLSPRHQTVAVDLPGHGETGAEPADCSIERYGAAVAELLSALDLAGTVLVGHSMGCRVVTEAALQNPARVAGAVLVDGSRFAPAMRTVLRDAFARPDGYAALTETLFKDMFTARSDKATAAAVIERVRRLPRPIGEKMLIDLQRYDEHRLAASLGCLRVPVMAIQTTTRDETGRQTPLQPGQETPYLAMLRAAVPSVRMEIIPDTGHFPQLDEPTRTNALLDSFIATLPGR